MWRAALVCSSGKGKQCRAPALQESVVSQLCQQIAYEDLKLKDRNAPISARALEKSIHASLVIW